MLERPKGETGSKLSPNLPQLLLANKQKMPGGWRLWAARSSFVVSIVGLAWLMGRSLPSQFSPSRGDNYYQTYPLAMVDGDPYIRALMRTITASESNVPHPYHVLYGGETVSDLSRHPDRCVPILRGPNRGDCSTAAGRYQFLNTTWAEKARQYHPHPTGILWWKTYSFQPFYQDKVVYRWLKDRKAWNADLSQLLREGEIDNVLRLLSGTWTSLGYGIESNSMSSHLPQIYRKILGEELKPAKESSQIERREIN